MKTPRSEIQVAHLDSKLYLAGGISRFRTSRRCEVFDLAQNHWDSCPKLPQAIHHVSLTTVNGAVVAGGGYTNLLFSFLEDPPLWSLNIDQQKWESIGQLPFEVGEHALVGIDSDLYLLGGRKKSGTSNELWRLRNEEWKPLASMNVARDSFAVSQNSHELWIIGGRNDKDGALDSVEVYNIATNTWSTRPPLPYRAGGLAAVHVSGKVHVFGGESLVLGKVYDRHVRFDPDSNSWVDETPPSEPRHGSAAINVGGKTYLLGGGSRAGWHTIYSVSGTMQILAE